MPYTLGIYPHYPLHSSLSSSSSSSTFISYNEAPSGEVDILGLGFDFVCHDPSQDPLLFKCFGEWIG